MPAENKITLFGQGSEVELLGERLSKKGFEVLHYLVSPYSDACIVLSYLGRTYTDEKVSRLISRLAPRTIPPIKE